MRSKGYKILEMGIREIYKNGGVKREREWAGSLKMSNQLADHELGLDCSGVRFGRLGPINHIQLRT